MKWKIRAKLVLICILKSSVVEKYGSNEEPSETKDGAFVGINTT